MEYSTLIFIQYGLRLTLGFSTIFSLTFKSYKDDLMSLRRMVKKIVSTLLKY